MKIDPSSVSSFRVKPILSLRACSAHSSAASSHIHLRGSRVGLSGNEEFRACVRILQQRYKRGAGADGYAWDTCAGVSNEVGLTEVRVASQKETLPLQLVIFRGQCTGLPDRSAIIITA